MAIATKMRTFLDAHLGRCPRCMRQSFVFMLGAWGLALALPFATSSPTPAVASAIAAASLTLLWLGHLAAFALRAAGNGAPAMRGMTGAPSPSDSPVQPRRRFMLAFTKAAAFAALATAFPLGTVFAQTCPCAAPLKCCFSFDAKYYDCAPSDAMCCGHPTNPWHCNSGSSCNGDGSTLPKCR